MGNRIEDLHRTICDKVPNAVNDSCITQDEDNNHDEINYPAGYPQHSAQCPEDKILKHVLDQESEHFQIVAVKNNTIPQTSPSPVFNDFHLTGSPRNGVSIDTVFRPFNYMTKIPYQNNFFDSANMGTNTTQVDFDISGTHYWQYLLEEMFRYCDSVPEKQQIKEYLENLRFDDIVNPNTSYIGVTLPSTNANGNYVISNAAIRKVLYPHNTEPASDDALNFLNNLKVDYKLYYRGRYGNDPNAREHVDDFNSKFNKICKFLKYSGDQSHILQMGLRPNEEQALLSRDRNLISRATLDTRVGRYACPYMSGFRLSCKMNMKLTSLAEAMMNDPDSGLSAKPDLEDSIRHSDSDIHDQYEFLVVYHNESSHPTMSQEDHLKHRGYLDARGTPTGKIETEINNALDRLIWHFENYFTIEGSRRQRDVKLANPYSRKKIDIKRYEYDTSLALGQITYIS
jgi:hypothetical protein